MCVRVLEHGAELDVVVGVYLHEEAVPHIAVETADGKAGVKAEAHDISWVLGRGRGETLT